jgi:hypothetical protein
MYPVPATETLSLQLNVKDPYAVKVYSTNGKLVYEKQNWSGNLDIHCASWSEGIYQLEVTMGKRVSRGTAMIMTGRSDN